MNAVQRSREPRTTARTTSETLPVHRLRAVEREHHEHEKRQEQEDHGRDEDHHRYDGPPGHLTFPGEAREASRSVTFGIGAQRSRPKTSAQNSMIQIVVTSVITTEIDEARASCA